MLQKLKENETDYLITINKNTYAIFHINLNTYLIDSLASLFCQTCCMHEFKLTGNLVKFFHKIFENQQQQFEITVPEISISIEVILRELFFN